MEFFFHAYILTEHVEQSGVSLALKYFDSKYF